MAQHRTGVKRAIERAALVGLIGARARRLEAERSLEELAGLAQAAGADVVLRVLQERPKPDPSTFLGAGKIQTLAASARRDRRRRGRLRRRADAGAAAAHRGGGRPQDHRSHAAHPRHLRAPRAHPRGQAAGRARAAEIPAAAAGRGRATRCRGWAAASAREGPAKPSSKPTAAASAPASTRSPTTSSRSASGASQLRERRHKASVPDRRARRLHQRRQDDAVQRADARRRGGVERPVRDPRSAGAPGAAAGQPRAARVRHRRLHRSAAARAGRGLPRHARGNRRRRPRAARHRRGRAGPRPPDARGPVGARRGRRRSMCRCSRSTTSATR